MGRKAVSFFVSVAVGMALAAPLLVRADDGAASIAAGGLVARRETRVTMAKEVLRISPDTVVVDYDFRNDTSEDVTTEVAFPVPPYRNGVEEAPLPEAAGFRSFKLWVDGKAVEYQAEATATLKGKDVTELLRANGVDIATFGHFEIGVDGKGTEVLKTPDFERLPKAAREQLARAGLFENADAEWGDWTVHLQFHWRQTFAAHSTVHIRHEYTPVAGAELMSIDTFKRALERGTPAPDAKAGDPTGEDLRLLGSFCPDSSLLRGVVGRLETSDPHLGYFATPQWVDFILTTANTWKQPIEDFTLIVERGKPVEDNYRRFVSFCSPQNAGVEKLDADHFQVHLSHFVPAGELHIGFFDVAGGKGAEAAGKKRADGGGGLR